MLEGISDLIYALNPLTKDYNACYILQAQWVIVYTYFSLLFHVYVCYVLCEIDFELYSSMVYFIYVSVSTTVLTDMKLIFLDSFTIVIVFYVFFY